MRLLRRITARSPLAWLLIGLLAVYRVAISPMLGQRCRFDPSCSRYALEAVRTHGAARGGWLAVRRLARCHPWGGAGFDPVPEPRRPEPARTSHPALVPSRGVPRVDHR